MDPRIRIRIHPKMDQEHWLLELKAMASDGCRYFLFGWRKSVVVDGADHCH
jgi:hypothetical protein